MKKKVKILIFIALLIGAIASLIGFAKRNGTKYANDKSDNTVDILNEVQSTGTQAVETPDIEAPSVIKMDGTTYKSITGGFSFDVPEGYTLSHSGNNFYLRSDTMDLQMVVVITDNKFESGERMYSGRDNYLYRMSGYYDDKEHDLCNIGSKNRYKKVVNGFPVVYENTEAWFRSKSDSQTYKTKAYGYYTILNPTAPDDWADKDRIIESTQVSENNEETENNKDDDEYQGIILIAFSDNVTAQAVHDQMDEFLSSIKPYEPTAEDLSVPVNISTYDSTGKDHAKIAYPTGWTVSRNEDGMISIQCPDNDSSPYAGVIIEYMTDEDHKVVEDYAQFSGSYEYQLMLPYFTQPVGANAFNYRTAITKTDLHATIGEKECILFNVTDEVIPSTKAVRYSMSRDSYRFNNIRYTFQSNGVDCMLNFIIPNDNCQALIDQLLAKTSLQ